MDIAGRRSHRATPAEWGGETLTTPAGNRSEAERRFAAFAAHELRGEITLQLALAEATLADPNVDTAALRRMGEQVIAACERQARLIEGLLILARSECGQLRRDSVDLAETAAEALRTHDHHRLKSATALESARTSGDPQLLQRLVANLVANAVRHNIPGGRLFVATHTAGRHAVLTIVNTGPVIPTSELARLFGPFQRLSSNGVPSADGVGLGLTIVQAIADAHDATVSARARAGGGLRIDVGFPAELP